jgi:adenylate cyclase
MGEEQAEPTFLFADLPGFTALPEAHGDEQAAELAGEFCEFVTGLLPEYEAEQVKTIGDAVMVRCGDPRAAVELGVRIVEEIGAKPQFPIVRVGMHTGPATERGGDWFGEAVNIAARVSGAARGDEVLLTAATREAAGQLESVELESRGVQRFKNVREEVALYRAGRRGPERAGLPIDPVCRMGVGPDDAAGTLRHGGQVFYFCSMECARAFAANPEQFIDAGSEGDRPNADFGTA